jgi:hypothetical protein
MRRKSSSWLVVMAMWVLLMMCSCSSTAMHHFVAGADAGSRGCLDVNDRSSANCKSIDHSISLLTAADWRCCQNEEVEMNGGDRRIVAEGIMMEALTSIDKNSEYNDQYLHTGSPPTPVSCIIARSVTDSPLSRMLSLRGGQAINQTKVPPSPPLINSSSLYLNTSSFNVN